MSTTAPETPAVPESAQKASADLGVSADAWGTADPLLKRIWRGFLAGVTSPTAVKAEKSLLTTVIVRLLIAAGGGYVTYTKLVGPAVEWAFKAAGL